MFNFEYNNLNDIYKIKFNMKRFIQLTFVIFLLFFGIQKVNSQCTPGDSISCPDPENNGEICPDILTPVFVGVEYSQEVTILAPPVLDTNDITIPLHHITLIEIGNLPEGISWEGNSINNEFLVGTYYCILLSGTTQVDAGIYPIKIVVDVYSSIGGNPIFLGQSIDSTSLTIHVKWDPDDIAENKEQHLINKVWPNPFSTKLYVELTENINETVEVEVFNMMGSRMFHQQYDGNSTVFNLDLSFLPEGVFMLGIKYRGKRYMQMVAKYN